jgi:hypothetical protein
MRSPTRKSLWLQAMAVALATSLAASPALAGSRKGHGHRGYDRGRGYDHGRGWNHHGGHGGHHVHYAGSGHYAYRSRGHSHHHHGGDADDVLLALGLGAVGLTAVALWAGAQQPVYYAPPAAAQPIDWNEIDEDLTVVSEGYNDRGQFCREFQKEIVVGGRVERGYGLACLQPDGSWRIGP